MRQIGRKMDRYKKDSSVVNFFISVQRSSIEIGDRSLNLLEREEIKACSLKINQDCCRKSFEQAEIRALRKNLKATQP